MKVSLRQRKKGNKITLYLDYYDKGKREYEYLGLYLTPEPEKGSLTKAQKDENKKILELAESIRSKRHLEAQNQIYGFRDKEKQKGNFLTFFEALTEKKKASVGNYGNWDSTKKHLQAYDPKGVSFERLDKDWLEGFKDYLDNVAITKTGEPICQANISSLKWSITPKNQCHPLPLIQNFLPSVGHIKFGLSVIMRPL